MRFDEDELSLIKEVREHSKLRFPEKPEERPNAINRLIRVCRNLAKSAFSKTEKTSYIDLGKQKDPPRYQ